MFRTVDKANTQHTGFQKFILLILFPLFEIKDISHYKENYLYHAIRWTIEIFFKECKQYLHLGKCESRDFDAQIAATTLCMLQYNLFSVVKRFESYESFGALFRQANSETFVLNIKERIYLIIKERLIALSDYFEFEPDILLKDIIADN
jgi:hypothetical protein